MKQSIFRNSLKELLPPQEYANIRWSRSFKSNRTLTLMLFRAAYTIVINKINTPAVEIFREGCKFYEAGGVFERD
jgi:hypothetical protein